MRALQQSRRVALWFCGAIAALALVGLVALGSGSRPQGTTLTQAEMAATFGDADTSNTPCQWNSKCNTSFTEGVSQCMYCNDPAPKPVCCDNWPNNVKNACNSVRKGRMEARLASLTSS